MLIYVQIRAASKLYLSSMTRGTNEKPRNLEKDTDCKPSVVGACKWCKRVHDIPVYLTIVTMLTICLDLFWRRSSPEIHRISRYPSTTYCQDPEAGCWETYKQNLVSPWFSLCFISLPLHVVAPYTSPLHVSELNRFQFDTPSSSLFVLNPIALCFREPEPQLAHSTPPLDLVSPPSSRSDIMVS